MTIKNFVNSALEKLQVNDRILIEKKMEWATAHRLAVYLEEYFPGWNIDCEYNKKGIGTSPKSNSQGNRKRPDIIIHRRERKEIENNLLIIEIKMEEGDDQDEIKLIDFTSPPSLPYRQFQYQIGLKITFLPILNLRWFIDGSEVN